MNKRLETKRLNKERRSKMTCKSYELKIDQSHLNQDQKETLKMFFVEAKWLYNYILSLNVPFDYDYKINPIFKKNKEGKFEKVQLIYLTAQCKKEIVLKLINNIKNLHKAKNKGLKVGRLKFKSDYNCIDLTNQAYRIVSKNKLLVHKIGRNIKVFGLEQIQKVC